ncbi:terminase family protein [bacterium]|nr:terminase family protein [bacterium]
MPCKNFSINKIMPYLGKKTLTNFNTMLNGEIVRKYKKDKLSFFVPHDKQKKFILSPARTKAFVGGNRSGKTTAGTIDVILECIGKHPLQLNGSRKKPPLFWRVVCVDFINGIEKIILPKFKEWLPAKYLIDGKWEKSWREKSRTLTLSNDSQIEFMSALQDREKFQGTSRDGLWIDEEIDKPIFQECQMRLLDRGGRTILTLTPINGMTWVYDDIYLKKNDPHIEVITVTTYENPHIDPSEIKIFADNLSSDEKRIRLNGEFVSLQGLVYKDFSDGPPLVVKPFPIPPEWTHYIGIDPHLRTPTAVLFTACDREGDLYCYDEIFSDDLISGIAEQIKMKFSHNSIFSSVIDPSSKQPNPVSGVSIKDEFARFGIHARNAKKNVHVGINRLSEYLRHKKGYPRIFIFETCEKLRFEFRNYIWEKNPFAGDKQSPRKKNDHLLDCLRYIVMENPVYIEQVKSFYRKKFSNLRSGY